MDARLPGKVLEEAYERQGVALLTLAQAVIDVVDRVDAAERKRLVEALLDVRAQAKSSLAMLERAAREVGERDE